MSTSKQLTALLLFTTALTLPAAAFAQDAGVGTGAEGVPADEDAATDALQAQQAQGIDNTPQEEEFEELVVDDENLLIGEDDEDELDDDEGGETPPPGELLSS